MKKLIYGGLFLALVGIGFYSCQKAEILKKEQTKETLVENEPNKNSEISKRVSQSSQNDETLLKEQTHETLVENEANKNSEISKSVTQSSSVLLASSLKGLNDYLFNSETLSGNTFFNYWNSNPNSTISDLDNAGFINKTIVLEMFGLAH